MFTHALDWLDRHQGYRPEVCVHLRPTYPARQVADVERVVDLLHADPSADSVRSVTVAPHTPYKMWSLAEDGSLRALLEGPRREAYNLPRQLLPPVYLQNAAVDAVRSAVIRQRRSMTGTRILPYVMEEMLDVDRWSRAGRAGAPGSRRARRPRGLTFAFDLDGVIATLVPDNDYAAAEPYAPAVALVNRLHEAGNRIVIYTARGSHTGLDWTETTRDQLRRWGVRYEDLRFGKPAADYYVDDRMMSLATLESWMESWAGRQGRKSA